MAEQVWWAIKAAPVADVEEWAVLVAMAEAADQDGCNSFLSANTIADRTRLAKRTVQRRMDELEKRALIRKGDQRSAAHIPVDRRPVVYDVMVPYSYFRLDKSTAEGVPVLSVDVWREGRGKPPLRPQDRPEIAPAPEKKRRTDHGVKRPRTDEPDTVNTDQPERDDFKSPGAHGTAAGNDATSSHHRGDYKTSHGVSGSHPTLPYNPPHDPPHASSAAAPPLAPPALGQEVETSVFSSSSVTREAVSTNTEIPADEPEGGRSAPPRCTVHGTETDLTCRGCRGAVAVPENWRRKAAYIAQLARMSKNEELLAIKECTACDEVGLRDGDLCDHVPPGTGRESLRQAALEHGLLNQDDLIGAGL